MVCYVCEELERWLSPPRGRECECDLFCKHSPPPFIFCVCEDAEVVVCGCVVVEDPAYGHDGPVGDGSDVCWQLAEAESVVDCWEHSRISKGWEDSDWGEEDESSDSVLVHACGVCCDCCTESVAYSDYAALVLDDVHEFEDEYGGECGVVELVSAVDLGECV